ncbi:MAG: phosphoribosylaminoimidazolesuccinocarboxamide synthase [Methanoculleaceae archaeon]
MTDAHLCYAGKAKSVYRTSNPDELLMEFRDDITAFDGSKHAQLPGKGECNARVSAFLFSYLEEHGVRTHYLRMAGPTTLVVRRLEMIPLEVIVRNIAAGSLVKRYPFREGQRLNPPVVVIDYKDDERHDPMINDEIIFALGLMSADELMRIREIADRVNTILSRYLDDRGLVLVDFKLEFGRYNNDILVGDEISMDSMRLWEKDGGRSLDKDVYRFDMGDVMEAYRTVARRILPEEDVGGR